MTSLKISDLKIHPQNDYYFDDVSGEKWEKLLYSIKNNGVRVPIIVTDNMVVVSGNQRVRACKELGIAVINAEIEHYKSEDDVIRDLIEINIRQRGVIDDSEIKAGRRFAFLQKYYGVQHGGDHKSENFQKSNPNNSVLKTQEQIASESGVSVDTMQNYIKLSQMIPELQDLVETRIVSPTTALAIVKQLPEDQQRELAEQLSQSDKKISGKEVDKEIERIKVELSERDRKIEALEIDRKERERYISTREDYIHELENREPEVREVVKEVVPNNYAELKKKAKEADAWEKDYKKQLEKVGEKQRQILELQNRIKELQEQTVREQSNNDMVASAIMFATQCKNFIESVGGYVFLSEHLMELPKREREGYQSSAQAVHDWAQIILNNIERKSNELLGSSVES